MLKTQTGSLSVKRWTAMGCLALLLLVPFWAAAEAPFERIVVFGTSLSDPGNAFAVGRGTVTPPDYGMDPEDLLIPDAPYAKGGHHFSNGPTWVEQLARPLGLARSVRPAFQGSNNKATNYAVGGARARNEGEFHLSAQVAAFLEDFNGRAPSNALYVIEMGGNDIRDALEALRSDPTGAASVTIITDALTSIGGNIFGLWRSGARHFMVWRLPNVGLTPAIRFLGPDAMGAAAQFTAIFNAELDKAVAGLQATLPEISIVQLDVHGKVNAILANPGRFDLTEVRAACITPDIPPFACRNADEYLFWDGIHPTKAGHGIIAHQAAHVILKHAVSHALAR